MSGIIPNIIKVQDSKKVLGAKEVTVNVKAGQKLLIVDETAFYKLGSQLDEVVQGHVLTDTVLVHWCHIEQKWVD